LFDGGWPDSPHRVLRNSTLRAWHASGSPPRGMRPGENERVGTFPDGRPMFRYDVATPWEGMDGDWESAALYAGASAALIHDVQPVREIIAEMEAGAENALRRAFATSDQLLSLR
jgi:nitronate monooxygenase